MIIDADRVLKLGLADGKKAERKDLQILIEYTMKDGETETIQYEWLGDDTTESAISMEMDSETTVNIKDVSRFDVKSVTMSQEISPFMVRAGSLTHDVIYNIYSAQDWGKLSQFTVILVRKFMHLDGKPYAERHVNCGVAPGDEGGATGGVDFPITVTYSNDKTLGYWEKDTVSGEMKFTPQVLTPTVKDISLNKEGLKGL